MVFNRSFINKFCGKITYANVFVKVYFLATFQPPKTAVVIITIITSILQQISCMFNKK